MFRSFGPMEIGLILLIVLIIFGVGKLPQVGGAIGRSIREFRKASRADNDEAPTTDPKVAQDTTAEKPAKS